MLSLLIVVLDNSILNVAIKTISTPAPTGLGATQSELEWAINSYTLVFAGLLFTAGLLGDRLGRKKVLLGGLVVFGIGSALAAMSGSPGRTHHLPRADGPRRGLRDARHPRRPDERLRARRAAQGHRHLGRRRRPRHRDRPDHRRRAPRPLLVGLGLPGQRARSWSSRSIADGSGWCPTPATPKPGRVDPVGVVLSVVGLVLLVYGIIKGGELADFTDPRCSRRSSAGLAVLAGFVVHEKRSDHPSIDISLLQEPGLLGRDRRHRAGLLRADGRDLLLGLLHSRACAATSPLQTGLLMLPLAAAQLIFAPRARLVVDRFGARAVCTGGMLLVAADARRLRRCWTRTPRSGSWRWSSSSWAPAWRTS